MVFAAWKWKINWKYNFPRVRHLYPIFKPHCGAFAAFPKQDDKYSTNALGGGGGRKWACLELTEPLIENVILPGKMSILCDI